MKDKFYDNADSFAMAFDEEWEKIDCEDIPLKIDKVFELLSDHPFLVSNPENARKMAEFRVFSLKKFQWKFYIYIEFDYTCFILVIEIYIVGELKKPLLNKNTVIPIIGPIPNTKSTNFAEFFVWPNFWFLIFDSVLIFLGFFFFIKK